MNNKMNAPLVSVIMPIHNALPFLPTARRALERLVSADVEFVIVNDHSSDGSMVEIADWSHTIAPLKVIHSVGQGVAAARNEALRTAQGKFLWFADCDDHWESDILKRLLQEAERNDADIVICNARKVVGENARESLINDAPQFGVISGIEALHALLNGDIQGHLWNKLFNRSLFDRVRFPTTRAHSDLGAMFSLFAIAQKVVLVPETLYTYFVRRGSILNQRSYRWEDLWDCLAIAERVVGAASKTSPLHTDLVKFRYQNVLIPLTHESIRRETWEPENAIARARKLTNSRIHLRDIYTLGATGNKNIAFRVIGIKVVPQLYAAIYRRHRRRSWSSIDEA